MKNLLYELKSELSKYEDWSDPAVEHMLQQLIRLEVALQQDDVDEDELIDILSQIDVDLLEDKKWLLESFVSIDENLQSLKRSLKAETQDLTVHRQKIEDVHRVLSE